jgi:hypothetical protein
MQNNDVKPKASSSAPPNATAAPPEAMPQLGANLNAPPPQGARRPALGQDLMANLIGEGWWAKTVFKTMNFAMYAEGQQLPPKHEAVLRQSLLVENNGVMETLRRENPLVMQSDGRTPVYMLGKYLVHAPLQQYLKMYPRDDGPPPPQL